ncbi:LPS export ABC transporter periplasmic protein LptC [Andreprevotia chitinilytica]|uniref:LPS export ABC transporter periplasmic protein LptC n=1 Tax=Andreprevotia chitinilytica TaxID=396808 RepID=UPI000551D4DD|nr:LPS export ABC transporter periplasmic protein LptC [Andreprevotia chitinilytica]
MRGSTRILPVTLLTLLGGLVWLLNDAANLPALGRLARPNDPDLIVNTATSVRFGEDGSPLAHLTADRVRHFPESDTAWFDQPRLHYTAPGEPALDVESPTARAEQKGERLWFPNDVKLHRAAPPDGSPLNIESSGVWLNTKQQLAWSSEAMRSDMGNYQVSSVGFEADLAQQTLLLKSKVKGIYEPLPPRR